MLKVCDGCKGGLDTDKDGSYPLPQNGAAPALFRANGAHPSLNSGAAGFEQEGLAEAPRVIK